MSDFSRAISEALAAVKSGEGNTAATATARVMRLVSEALLSDLRAGDCVITRVGDRRVWRHPEGVEVALSAHASGGFVAEIRHPLGALSGGFAFFDPVASDSLFLLLN